MRLKKFWKISVSRVSHRVSFFALTFCSASVFWSASPAFALPASPNVLPGVLPGALPASPCRSLKTCLPLKLERDAPEIDALIAPDTPIEKLTDGYKWVEGPVWTRNTLYFADVTHNNIRKLNGKTPEIWLAPSGYQGKSFYPGPESGTNGMTLDPKERLTVAGHARRNVMRFDKLDRCGTPTVLADSYDGKPFNSPNDLVYRSDGSLYFTDPPYGLPTQKDDDPLKKLPWNGVYRLPGATERRAGSAPDNAPIQLLIKNLSRPNGLAFSPGEKYLYVSNSEPKKFWMRYRVRPDGALTEPRLLRDVTSDPRHGNPDGIKIDEEGHLYAAGPGGVWIMSPTGTVLGVIAFPEQVSNVAFGGADRKRLYVTTSNAVYRLDVKVPGLPTVQTLPVRTATR